MNLKSKQILLTTLAIFVLPSLLLAVKVKNNYYTKASTSFPAKLLLPSAINATVGQESTAVISLDTGGGGILAADIKLNFNPTQLDILSIEPSALVTFPSYVPSDMTAIINRANATGSLSFSTLRTDINSQSLLGPFTGSAVLATLKFTPRQTGVFNINFDFLDGSNTDSNVILAGDPPSDILSSVGNLVITSTSVPATSTPAPAANIAPAVNITNPSNTTIVDRLTTVNIQAEATSQVGINRVTFFVNGTNTCTVTSAPYTCAWRVPGKKGTTYTLTATAADNTGITSSTSIQVTAK